MVLAAALMALGALMFLGEVAISAWLGRPLHRWNDTLSAFAMQAATGFVSHFGKIFLFALYIPLYQVAALREWGGAPWEWLFAFLAYELAGYWFHRISHRTNLGWAIHVVHHQSEELNLSTAMRTAPLRSLVDWPTVLPLAVLGIPPHAIAVLYVLHAAGQYWLHVKWIPGLGPLGWVLNTPSHHRVHHGCQAGYQDANYGAHLIIWDRVFGTFVPETEAPEYGVTRSIPAWDPLRSTLEPFAAVWNESLHWRGWDRVRVWWMPPGWTPDAPHAPRGPLPQRRSDFRPRRLGLAVWNTVVTSALLLAVPGLPAMEPAGKVALVVLGLWSMRVMGLHLDSHTPDPRLELLRALALVLAALLVPPLVGAGLVAIAAVTAVAPTVSSWRSTPGPASPRMPRSP